MTAIIEQSTMNNSIHQIQEVQHEDQPDIHTGQVNKYIKKVTDHISAQFVKSQSKSIWAELVKNVELTLVENNSFDQEDQEKVQLIANRFIDQLMLDLTNYSEGKEISDCALQTPRQQSKFETKYSINIVEMIKSGLWAKLQQLDYHKLGYTNFGKLLADLSRVYVEQHKKNYIKSLELKTCAIEKNWKSKTCSISKAVGVPTPMEVIVPEAGEFEPLFNYLKANKAIDPTLYENETFTPKEYILNGQKELCCVFNKGALYKERVDLCKQVVGPPHIEGLMNALQDNTQVSHFLLGNNIMGPKGCLAIKNFLTKPHGPKIQTWYLAGNEINADGLGYIVNGLINDTDNSCNTYLHSLWLKRNPIYASGMRHIRDLLKTTTTLRVLDLNNTAIGLNEDQTKTDIGMQYLCEGLEANNSLRYLYLSANALTKETIKPLINYFENRNRKRKGITSLWIDMNFLENDGIIELLEALKYYPDLKRLAIGSNKIDHNAIPTLISCLEHKNNLKSLDLGSYKSTADMGVVCNLLGDESAELLCKFIAENKSLQSLGLYLCGISPKGMMKLADAICENNNSLYQVSLGQVKKHENADDDMAYNTALKNIQVKLKQNIGSNNFNIAEHRALKHSNKISFIDSIYRNSDK